MMFAPPLLVFVLIVGLYLLNSIKILNEYELSLIHI